MRSHSILRPVFAVALSVVAAGDVRAQSLDWVKQAGGTISTGGQSVESAEAIALDSLGNSYITGTFRIEATFGIGEPNETVLRGVGPQDIFVAKYDPNGLLLWARRGGGGGIHQDWAWDIAVDQAGNSYITGSLAYGTTHSDFGDGVTVNSPGAFVVKYDTEGNTVWATTLDPNGAGYAIDVDADGNSFIAGTAPEPIQFLPLVTVWKVGATGTTQWTRSASGTHSGAALGISVDTNGNSAVTGTFEGGTATFGPGEPNQTTLSCVESGSGLLFVAKYDTSGNLMWARQSADRSGFGGRGNAIATDGAGSSYLVGIGFPILGPGEPNETAVTSAFVAKYDGLGNLAWARTVAPPFGQVSWLFGIAHSPAGHTYITGTSVQGNIFIEKYSNDGDVLSSRRVAAASVDALELRGSIALDSAGNLRLAGVFSGAAIFAPGDPNETLLTTTSGNFDFDVFVARFLDGAPVENVPPVAADQSVTTAEDTPLAIALTAADADGDPLTYSVVTPPAHGVLSGTAPAITYTPQPNFHGVDAFTFRVFDGDDFSGPATVTITVTPDNDAPVANDQSLVTAEDTPVAVTLTGQDLDGDSLSFSVATGPSHGTLSGALPNLTYTPALDFVGSDSFTFTASDGAATSPPATVAITVGFSGIGCGTLTSASIATAGEVDRYSFVGQSGQIISVALASSGGFSTNPGASSSAELTVFAPSGAVVGALRSNSQANLTLAETGAYVVRVRATNLTRTGSYNLNLECLAPPSPDAVPLTCGTLGSGQIGAQGQVDLFTFSGLAGQIMSLALASNGGFSTNPGASSSAELTVFAPSGAVAGALRSNSQANFTLPEAGTYVIRVSATNLATTGSYNLNLECLIPASPDAVPVSCGTLAPGQIGARGQVDLFTFAGPAGQIMSLALASSGGFSTNPGASSSAELTVFAPSGAVAGALRSNSQGNFTLPETGTYVIRVSATNLATTGTYNLNLECLVPASADAVPVSCGTLASGQIGARGQVDLFTFSGLAGQIMSLALASSGGFSTNPGASSSAELTVFAPSGAVAGALRSNSQANFTLPQAGTYVIRVSATNLATTGSYNLNLECLVPASPDAVPVSCGTLASGQIGARGQVDLFTFSGLAGQIMSLALASSGGFSTNPGASSSAELTVFAPSGAVAGALRSNSQGNFTLPQAGTYVIRVSATNLATTGSYNLNLECLVPASADAVPVSCGTVASGQIGAPGQVDLFTLSGQAGQIVSVALASAGGFSTNPGASSSAELTVFAPSAAVVGALRSNSQANFTLPDTGTYAIRVSATNLARTGSYRLTLGCSSASLSGVQW